MISEKKIEFLIKQGFERDVVKVFVECGVEKHLLWFLTMHKKGFIEYLNGEDVRMINNYLEKSQISKNKKVTYSEALVAARKFEQNEKRKMKNKIYNFKNGHYISILNSIDLREEGHVMSNCVGSYEEKVHCGIVGILALKNPSGKTISHIEIKKNGLIGQNYAKANSQINKECWMMILEFFENNSKSVDLSRAFGESYIATCTGGYINEMILTIPTSINTVIDNGVKKTEQISGFEIKRFIPFPNPKELAIKLSSQSEAAEWIERKKEEITNAYDEMIVQILSTSASKMYLSDKIKELIFGTKKGAYLMKGEEYNLSEIDPRYGQKDEPIDGYAMPEPAYNNDVIAERPMGALVPNQGEEAPVEQWEAPDEERVPDPIENRIRPIILLGRRRAIAQQQAENEENRHEGVPVNENDFMVYDDAPEEARDEPREDRPRLDVVEIPFNGGYDVDEMGEVDNAPDREDITDELIQQEFIELMPPEPFNQIIRRAIRG